MEEKKLTTKEEAEEIAEKEDEIADMKNDMEEYLEEQGIYIRQ